MVRRHVRRKPDYSRSAFNYPAFLTLGPLVIKIRSPNAQCLTNLVQSSAIAAGNAVVVKSSENCPAFSNLLAELFPKYLDSSLYRVVNGAVPETTKVGPV